MHPELWTPCVNALCVLHDCVPWGLSPYFDPPHSLAITPQAHTYTARPDLHERMGGAQRRGAVVDAATALSDNSVLQGATWAELDRAKYRCYVDALDPLVLTLMQDRIRALDPEAVQPLQVHPLTMSAALIFVIENFHLPNHTSTTCQKFALRLFFLVCGGLGPEQALLRGVTATSSSRGGPQVGVIMLCRCYSAVCGHLQGFELVEGPDRLQASGTRLWAGLQCSADGN